MSQALNRKDKGINSGVRSGPVAVLPKISGSNEWVTIGNLLCFGTRRESEILDDGGALSCSLQSVMVASMISPTSSHAMSAQRGR